MPRKKPTPELTNALLQEQREAIDSVFPRERTYADLSDEELISLFDVAFEWASRPDSYEIARAEDPITIKAGYKRFALYRDGDVYLNTQTEFICFASPFAFVRKCWALGLKY